MEAGGTATLTLEMNQPVTVYTSGGTPTLTLNDGGTATYTGGSGSERADLHLHGSRPGRPPPACGNRVNLNGATITNANGNANLSLSGLTQTGPQVDGTPTLAIDGNDFSRTSGRLRPTSP